MGPVILKKQGKETLYSIRAFPVGGFCAMEGEDTEEATENPRAFNNKSWWKKIIILVAGAAMNIIIAFLVMIFAAVYMGTPTTTINSVTDGGAASMAGIQAGDKIVRVSDSRVDSWEEFVGCMQKEIKADKTISITVERNGKEKTFSLSPQRQKNGKYVIGVVSKQRHNLFIGMKNGMASTVKMTKALFESFKMLFTSKEAINQVSGPVGMIKIVSDAAGLGVFYYLYLVALISLNLAIFNLLPLPALDGGRIIFVIIRMFTGRAISDKVEARVHMIGMALLLTLTVFVTWNDIMRLIRR